MTSIAYWHTAIPSNDDDYLREVIRLDNYNDWIQAERKFRLCRSLASPLRESAALCGHADNSMLVARLSPQSANGGPPKVPTCNGGFHSPNYDETENAASRRLHERSSTIIPYETPTRKIIHCVKPQTDQEQSSKYPHTCKHSKAIDRRKPKK